MMEFFTEEQALEAHFSLMQDFEDAHYVGVVGGVAGTILNYKRERKSEQTIIEVANELAVQIGDFESSPPDFKRLYMAATGYLASGMDVLSDEFTGERMRFMGSIIQTMFPKVGFALVVFPFAQAGISNYISNADRRDMIKSLRETASRIEKNEDNRTS